MAVLTNNQINTMIAVIKTGGKQYIVSPGKKIKVEKLDQEVGSQVVFEEVLLVEQDGKTAVGTPFIKNGKVIAEVLRQGKAVKKIAFRFKSKTRQATKKGFRQPFTEVEIKAIEVK